MAKAGTSNRRPVAVQRPGQGRRFKGDLHSPKGEAKKHSAKPELKRSGPLHPGDLDSSAEPERKGQKSLGSVELDKTREWLLGELRARGVANPGARWAMKGRAKEPSRIQVYDGKAKFGTAMHVGDFIARSLEAVEALFRLPGCVTLLLDRDDTKPLNPVLFGVVDATLAGQRAVVMSLLRGGSAEDAYDVQCEASHEWLRRSKKNDAARDLNLQRGGLLNVASKMASEKYAAWEATGQAKGDWPSYHRRSVTLAPHVVEFEWLRKPMTETRRGKALATAIADPSIEHLATIVADMLVQHAWEGAHETAFRQQWKLSRSQATEIIQRARELARGPNLWVTLDLCVNGTAPPLRFRAYPKSCWEDVRKMLVTQQTPAGKKLPEWEKRSSRLLWDENDRQWKLCNSVLKPKPEQREGTGALVVIPTMDGRIQVWRSDGWLGPSDDSPHLIALLKQVDRRKSEKGTHRRHQGSGARGHGRNRFNRLMSKLNTAVTNTIDSNVKQRAADVAKIARGERIGSDGRWEPKETPVGETIVHDFASACPTLGRCEDAAENRRRRRVEKLLRRARNKGTSNAMAWALRKSGCAFRMVKVPNLCPACGEVKLQRLPGGDWNCPHCHTTANRDLFTAWQTFVAGGESPHYDLAEVAKAFRRAIDFAKSCRPENHSGTEETDQATQ